MPNIRAKSQAIEQGEILKSELTIIIGESIVVIGSVLVVVGLVRAFRILLRETDDTKPEHSKSAVQPDEDG